MLSSPALLETQRDRCYYTHFARIQLSAAESLIASPCIHRIYRKRLNLAPNLTGYDVHDRWRRCCISNSLVFNGQFEFLFL
jgi:hypothetical protein